MEFKFPKNDDKYYWTNHVGRKMMFYGLSADRIKRIMRSPKRSEKGIAEGTIAVMCPYGTSPGGRQPYRGEVWVMYAQKNLKPKSHNMKHKDPRYMIHDSRKVIITAWRYPGISPVRDEIPIPVDILEELKKEKW